MKKFLKSKFFLAFWAILVIVFNVVLFLATNEMEKNTVFWVIYGFVMGAFVLMLVMRLLSTTEKNLDTYVPLMVPLLLAMIFLGVILFFFTEKLKVVWVCIPFAILLGLVAIAIVLSAFYAHSLKYVPEKKVELVSFSQLIKFVDELEPLCENENEKVIINKLQELVAKTNLQDDNTSYKQEIFEYLGFLKKNLVKKEENNFYNNAEKVEYYLQKRG